MFRVGKDCGNYFDGDGVKEREKKSGERDKICWGNCRDFGDRGSEQPQIRKTAPQKESGPRLVKLGILLSNRYS